MDIDWFNLGMGLFGGLALFLAGLDMLSEGLKKSRRRYIETPPFQNDHKSPARGDYRRFCNSRA